MDTSDAIQCGGDIIVLGGGSPFKQLQCHLYKTLGLEQEDDGCDRESTVSN